MSALKWSDLEALGWTIKRYDAHTRRYTYKTPVRNSKTKTIAAKRDLDPCCAVLARKDYLLESVCREDLKTGGGTSVIYFKEEEKAAIKKELRELSPLGDPQGREKVDYTFRVRGPWKGLTMAKVQQVVQHKAGLYDLERGRI